MVQFTTTVLISNLHCPTCSSNISEILSRLFPRPQLVSTSIVKQTVTVTHGPELLPREIVKTLLDAEFEVDSVALSEGNHPVDSFSPVGNEAIPVFSEARGWLEEARMLVGRFMQSNQGKLHLDICAVCRQVVSDNALPGNLVSSLPGDNSAASPLGEKRSVVNIQTEGLSTWEVSISIGGMTCTSCTGSIAKKLEELAWVKEVVINLMSNSGLVKFESATGKQEADALVNAIEDMGFDATLNSLKNLEEKACTGGPSSIVRKVSLIVKGMYCHRCPEKILSTLETSFPDIISIEVAPSVREPVITMLYRPSPHITIRKILEVLSDIEPVFQVSVFHPPTIEERSKKIQLKERNTYLRHWVLCIICAIPTFLIGIVWMALVPTTDPIRMFMEEPIWAGKVSRFEWVLFILSTPVMFYAAGPFHKKAILEIVSLWRPGNSAPILRRFLRFGSMNLLISLGVSISYFASIAMLAMQAVKDRHSVLSNKHVTTYFDSTVFLTMFLLMGRYLEAFSKAKTADGVSLLASLRPKDALLVEFNRGEAIPATTESSVPSTAALEDDVAQNIDKRDFISRRVATDLLEVGDIVSIVQGASPPVDAVVVSGSSHFDESSLTGESHLVSKKQGDTVYTGTINHGQVINARVEKVGGDSMIDKIVDVVREGQNRRAPIERIADKVTAYFVPVICMLAISTWLVWLCLGVSNALPLDYLDSNDGGWYFWSLSFAIAVFVVACPCGIGLAAPCALHVGTGIAARHAILARGGGEAFQEASLLDCVVFDKTGTLTQGVEPVISDEEIVFDDDNAIPIIYHVARLLEESSSHPLARSVVNLCNKKLEAQGHSISIEEIAGNGSKGTVEIDGLIYEAIIGNERFMQENRVSGIEESAETLEGWKRSGKSIILLAIKSNMSVNFGSEFSLAIMFATTDPIREEAPFVVKGLQDSGIDVWMLTGDNPTTASAVASKVGIPESHVIAGVLPTEKADKVRELQKIAKRRTGSFFSRVFGGFRTQKNRAIVAMVGDGINDAPALAISDVGISIGSGSDVAIQTSKFILVSSNLVALLTLTDLSRAVIGRVKFNFLWACVFNVLAIPLAAGVLYPFTSQRVRLQPVWAALAMALSSVSVICCSLLLRVSVRGIGFRTRKWIS